MNTEHYTEYQFNIQPKDPWAEILLAHLQYLPFDSFMETPNGFNAYFLGNHDIDEQLNQTIKTLHQTNIQYQKNKIKKINWNSEWENNFQPIQIGNQCYIRAEFHAPQPQFKYEIVIQPKMSFGTGHHATTQLILEFLIDIDTNQLDVLDMGCGTAVLGILAKLKGANDVEAIDIDQWAYENAIENAQRNNTEINVRVGDASILTNKQFDLIVANINKNVLLQDIPTYIAKLKPNSKLILSGLLDIDFDEINDLCTKNGLNFVNKKQQAEWIAILYQN